VQTDHLDQRPDLRLSTTQQDLAAVRAQPARQHREVEHQRRIGEDETAEIYDDIPLSVQGANKSLAPTTLSGPVLVAAAAKNGGLVLKVDDRGNLSQLA
jgi:hypothetical protein